MNKSGSSVGFYADLKAFDDFTSVADTRNYVLAPDDWHIIIADIQGSTSAIEAGRYKDVNMIGAACINSLLNVCANDQIPYVFGGDGATLLVPDHRLQSCIEALCAVRYLSESSFGLKLRIGVVAVSQVNCLSDCQLLVGKFCLSPNNFLATFAGGGIERAERWIKSDPDYLIEKNIEQPPNLDGLSCRWEPLSAENGVMLSILLQVKETDSNKAAKQYRSVIQAISEITTGAGDAKPIRDSNMVFRWPPRGLAAEIKATCGNRPVYLWAIWLYVNSLFQWMLDRFNWTAGGYRGRKYRVELQQNTDYRRFDDVLRVLLDCTETQADNIERMLAERANRDELEFGTHRADSALMTCLVFNLERKQHIHFVDGNHGGFTSAAKMLKATRS